MLDSFNVNITKIVKLPKVVIDNYPEQYADVQDLVSVIHVKAEATKHNNTITEEDKFHVPYVSDCEFINYSDLTEQQVLSWISSDIENLKNKLESFLDSQADEDDNIIDDITLPWNTK